MGSGRLSAYSPSRRHRERRCEMSRKNTAAPAGDDDRQDHRRMMATQFELLDALLHSPDGQGSLGDRSRRHDTPFRDNGPWRGIAIAGLSRDMLIERVGATQSKRPSRHKTIISKWKMLDREACHKRWRYLRDELAKKTKRGPDAPTSEPQSDQLNPHRRSKQRKIRWAD